MAAFCNGCKYPGYHIAQQHHDLLFRIFLSSASVSLAGHAAGICALALACWTTTTEGSCSAGHQPSAVDLLGSHRGMRSLA